jgi:Leu/Phe-tRNA-protein transferase
MAEDSEDNRQRIIETCERALEFQSSDDGFIGWWPAETRGYLTSDDLRIIADELDKRNAEWQAQIDKDLSS